MTDDFIWMHVRNVKKKVGSNRDKAKEESEFTVTEKILRERLCHSDEMPREFGEVVEDDEGGDDNDGIVSTASSVAGQGDIAVSGAEVTDDTEFTARDDEEWDRLSEEVKVKEATSGLKKLGNVKRRPYNKKATTDMFTKGASDLQKKIIKIRKRALRRYQRKLQLIRMAVKYFHTQMQYRRKILRKRLEMSRQNTFVRSQRPSDLAYKTFMLRRREDGMSIVNKP